MKLKESWRILAPAVILSVGMAFPVFAQSHPSASDSMDAAGQSMEHAGSDTADAAKDTYHGTATALRDTKITAKVKTALHEDEATEHGDIHVRTVAGVVTLRGRVGSDAVAARAERLAQSTEGVREVDNKLRTTNTASN